jgi:hypothetical protein
MYVVFVPAVYKTRLESSHGVALRPSTKLTYSHHAVSPSPSWVINPSFFGIHLRYIRCAISHLIVSDHFWCTIIDTYGVWKEVGAPPMNRRNQAFEATPLRIYGEDREDTR